MMVINSDGLLFKLEINCFGFFQKGERNDKIYSGETLVEFLHALSHIIRGHCEKKSVETSIKTDN